jgi:hypothetical protein
MLREIIQYRIGCDGTLRSVLGEDLTKAKRNVFELKSTCSFVVVSLIAAADHILSPNVICVLAALGWRSLWDFSLRFGSSMIKP